MLVVFSLWKAFSIKFNFLINFCKSAKSASIPLMHETLLWQNVRKGWWYFTKKFNLDYPFLSLGRKKNRILGNIFPLLKWRKILKEWKGDMVNFSWLINFVKTCTISMHAMSKSEFRNIVLLIFWHDNQMTTDPN